MTLPIWHNVLTESDNVSDRVLDHAKKDRKSNMFKHSIDSGHPPVCMKSFKILTKGFNHCKFKNKI